MDLNGKVDCKEIRIEIVCGLAVSCAFVTLVYVWPLCALLTNHQIEKLITEIDAMSIMMMMMMMHI